MGHRNVFVALILLGCIGCTTIPSTGSRVWYDQRMGEIQAAYDNGELSDQSYLELKNQTDQTRVDYQNALRDRAYYYPRPGYYSPFFYGGHHFYRHHHYRHHHH